MSDGAYRARNPGGTVPGHAGTVPHSISTTKETKRGNEMTPTRHRVGPAILAACALMLAAVATPSANAADTATGLTMKAGEGSSLAGQGFDAYRLGAYRDVSTAPDGRVTGLTIHAADDAAARWAEDAIGQWNAKHPGEKVDIPDGYDAAGAIARLTGSSDADRVRGITGLLADSSLLPEPTAHEAGSGETTRLDVPDGLYLVTITDASDHRIGMMLQGTRIGGRDLEGSQLGEAYVKTRALNVDKTVLDANGDPTDHAAPAVGDVVSWRATHTIPGNVNGAARTLSFTDTPQGMTTVEGSVKASVGGQDVTNLMDISYEGAGVPEGGWTAQADRLLAEHPNRKLTIDYRTRIVRPTAVAASAATQTAGNEIIAMAAFWDGSVGGGTSTVEARDEADVKSAGLTLVKTDSQDADTLLDGAGFTVRRTHAGSDAWQTWDAKTGMWSAATDQEHATVFLTGDSNHDGTVDSKDDTAMKGRLRLEGLGEGEWTIRETRAPEGYLSGAEAMPELTATVDAQGHVTVRAGGLNPGLVTDLGDGTVRVANARLLTQLPQTGMALFTGGGVLLALLLLGGAGLLLRRARHVTPARTR